MKELTFDQYSNLNAKIYMLWITGKRTTEHYYKVRAWLDARCKYAK